MIPWTPLGPPKEGSWGASWVQKDVFEVKYGLLGQNSTKKTPHMPYILHLKFGPPGPPRSPLVGPPGPLELKNAIF